MSLLEDQIEEAQAALIAAHDAKDVEGAQVLADHVRELQAQKDTVDKAALESSKEGTNLRNPLIAGGTGAVAGALVNPVINAAQDIVARPKLPSPPPSQITTPAAPWTPPKFTPQGMPVDPNVPRDVYHWMSGNPESGSTGQHAGVPVRGRNQLEAEKLAQEFHAKNAARADFEAKNPGRSILDNGLEVSKADYDYVEGMKKKNQDAALLEHRIEQNAAKSAAAKQAESAGRFNILPSAHQPSTPFSIVKGGAKGAVTGASIADIPQQLSQGNYGTAVADTGIAGGNIINSLGRTPKTKAIGKLIGIGSGVLRGVQGVNELTGAPEEQKATGGLVHLAGGGQPEFGEARAYEPSLNERIYDKIAPYIGKDQARGLMGRQGADSYTQYNPLSWLAQTPGSLGQNAKDFVKSSKEGDYAGAAGSYLSGLMDAAPMLGKASKVASLISYNAGNKAFEKGSDLAAPYAEKAAEHIVPPIARAVRFAKKYLPSSEGVLSGSHITPELYHGKGVSVQGYAGGKRVIAEEALGLAKKIFTPRETKILRASEALAPHEGKWLNLTQSDRMRSTEGDLGGPGFSKFQLEHPDYAEAQAAWGVGKKQTASGIVNVNKRYPEGQSIWAPMIGSETQHHSNQHVYDALTNEFNRQAAMGKLPPELQARINARMQNAPSTKGMFPEGFDVGNPEHLAQYGDTFNRRGEVSKVLSGEGVGGTKGRVIDYPGIMQEMTDPMTMGAPTHSMGTRLFNLTGEVEHRPDLHSAFPYILKGEDQGVAFAPVPKELGIQDFINQFKEFKGREPGYYDLTRTTPSQQITDKYLKSLDKAGHKKGGKVKKAKK